MKRDERQGRRGHWFLKIPPINIKKLSFPLSQYFKLKFRFIKENHWRKQTDTSYLNSALQERHLFWPRPLGSLHSQEKAKDTSTGPVIQCNQFKKVKVKWVTSLWKVLRQAPMQWLYFCRGLFVGVTLKDQGPRIKY